MLCSAVIWIVLVVSCLAQVHEATMFMVPESGLVGVVDTLAQDASNRYSCQNECSSDVDCSVLHNEAVFGCKTPPYSTQHSH